MAELVDNTPSGGSNRIKELLDLEIKVARLANRLRAEWQDANSLVIQVRKMVSEELQGCKDG